MTGWNGLQRGVLFATIHGVTLAAATALVVIAALDPDLFARLVRKDNREGTGLVEHLTVLVLLPGIAAGIVALARYWRAAPKLVRAWVAMWIVGCVYFAGEECSWGQWFFHWKTPEFLAQVNDQGETNLHNISPWLDQKPRALVEAFVILAGFVMPVFRRLVQTKWQRAKRSSDAGAFWDWVLAPPLCWSAGAVVLLLRADDFIRLPTLHRLGNSELLELAIAWFLSIYLLSFLLRLCTGARREPDGFGSAP